MDEDEEYSDTREELLRRFREALAKPMSERFFDEDDLIEVFDYAGDLNDDYLRIEALMCGARFFPDSEELRERRGIFYAQYSGSAQAQFLRDNPVHDNFILHLLALRNDPPEPEQLQQQLTEMIAQQSSLSDEEVIQFVDLCSYLNLYQWLKDNIEMIRPKVRYEIVLIYEVAIVADLYKDYAYAVELLDKLTDLEPFNSYYWMLLSRVHAEEEEWEKAMNAIDYSLAINPNAYQSLLVKAKLMYAMEKPFDEVEAIAKKAIELGEGDLEAVKYLASIYNSEGHSDKASQLLTSALEPKMAERDLELIPELLLYAPENAEELLDRFFKSTEDNSQFMWASWAQQLSAQGFPDLAKLVIECYEKNTGIKIPSLFTIEDSFIAQNFNETIDQLQEYVKSVSSNEGNFPSIVAMHLVSMVKSGNLLEAYSFCKFLDGKLNIGEYRGVSNRLEYIGLQTIIKDIKEKIENSMLKVNPTMPMDEWVNYDPFNYWSNNSN